MALLNLENIAVLAISKEVVQGIGHGSPQVIIRLVFAQIIGKINGIGKTTGKPGIMVFRRTLYFLS